MKRSRIAAAAALLLIMLAGCAPGPNRLTGTPDEEGEVAGFWMGLWQGAIMPISFLVSLFTSDVQIYEVHNNGGWYNLGYLLGLMIVLGGSSGGASRGSRSRR
jgi:hypothetical protein